jgi:1,4-dihydroxy-2-naphthoate octaprenyltransferase
MIGGTYFVTTGAAPAWVFLASVPYALLVTAVLIGKHIDKLPADSAKGIRTLPVILGEDVSRSLNQALMVAFYAAVVALALTGVFGLWTFLVLLTLPRLIETLRAFAQPRPDEPPAGYPIWPLWYVAWAFRLTRTAGGCLVVALLLNAFFPLYL